MHSFYAAPVLALGLLIGTSEAQAPEFEATPLADGVHLFRWQSHQSLVVVTDDGVVAVDPISTVAAQRFAEEIRRLAPGKPLRAIVYSHHHADHASGADVLRKSFGGAIPIVAHANAAPRIAEAGDTDLPPPDLTFTSTLTLHFGGRIVELHYLGRSHSDNMVVTYLPEERLAFAVDFVSNDRMGYRDLPDYYFPDFFESLERLLELGFETIAFGHGPTGDRGSIERQVAYYRDLREAVANAIERGWSEEEAAERVKLAPYAEWGNYEEWFPLNVRAIYRWQAAAR
jgi:cyclase